MIIFKKAADITKYIGLQHQTDCFVGFVPTMGALHEGHLSLIKKSKQENTMTVCSIYVNPTQFNNPSDFEKYPVTIENDIKMLEESGCDVLFIPSSDEIYPEDFKKENYNLGYLEEILEGKYRPGHFQGVCMVVDRLLQIIKCDILYLGKKDFQQCMVIRKMTQLKNFNVIIKEADTIREMDGLAMSSRNRRLNPGERKTAVLIYETLLFMKNNIHKVSSNELKQKSFSILNEAGFNIDYIEITDSSLLPIEKFENNKTIYGLIAASINGIRLIDNMPLN